MPFEIQPGSQASGLDAPVVVVGAGPVGLACALLLARHGVASIVVDRRRHPSEEGSKAICIQRDSLEICNRIGIAEAMVAEGVTWSIGRTYYREQELFQVELPHHAEAFPPFINISQARTEELLVAAANAQPLIDLRYGWPTAGLSEEDDHVVVQSDAGNSLRAAYVIGADGSRSTVRRAIGATFSGRSFDEQFLIADIRCDLGFGNERRFFFDPVWNPDRQVLVHACPDGVWRIDWQVPATFDLAAEQASGALDERIRRIVEDRHYEIVWLSVYRFHQRRASTFVGSRTVLVGDSAHIYAPFGARGLNAGFHDAENAAWKLAALLHGWGGPELLRSYAVEREAAADENLRVTGETMEFLVPADPAAWERRRTILDSARTDPAMRKAVNSGRLAEAYWYNDSPLTTDGSLEGFPTEPGLPRPLVPGVLCPDVEVIVDGQTEPRRLRASIGRDFVLVLPADLPETVVEQLTDVLGSTDVPCSVVHDPTQTEPGRALLVRPDGFLAACLPLGGADSPLVSRLETALRRASGWAG